MADSQPDLSSSSFGDDPTVDDARTRILAAAGPVFARHGFDRATVREICRQANVNVAAVGYYFGDKMGLYRQVIRQIHDSKERRFPSPAARQSEPTETLRLLVYTLLSRMLAGDASGWESQLMMREMQQPTAIFGDLVQESFRPLFEQLVETFRLIIGSDVPRDELEKFAFSTIGQCLYFRIGRGVIQILVPETTRKRAYDLEQLSQHVTSVMLAAAQTRRNSHHPLA